MELDKAHRGQLEGSIRARIRVNRRPDLEKLRVWERRLRLGKLLLPEMRLPWVLRPRWGPLRRRENHLESGDQSILITNFPVVERMGPLRLVPKTLARPVSWLLGSVSAPGVQYRVLPHRLSQ